MSTTRRQFVQSIPAFAVAGHMLMESHDAYAATASFADDHFHPLGKAPSEFTKAVLRQARASLPFGDKKDFEEQQKGFIAPMKDLKIIDDNGGVVWNMQQFQFIDQKDEFDSIHPSMHRIAKLNMNRRLFYQYGVLLPVNPYGYVTQGLGHGISRGNSGLIAPTYVVEQDIEEIEVDGIRMIFQNTPNTEAPSEMNTYIPDMKALWMAENVNATLHNIYTLRGALVRDALSWSKYINEALYLYGQEAEVMFTAHHWPRWGNDRVQDILRSQRDLYANFNNQVLHLANQGVTINQIHNVFELPKSLQQKWECRGYHGSVEHNCRGVVNRFLGFWDCNPATLIPLSPEDSAPLYVEMMGGSAKILARGKQLHDEGKYLLAQEVLNKLVQAEPNNQDAKNLLADVFEQIGYQQENPGLRNSFLAGAYELRSGIPQGASPKSSGPDVIRAMSTELFLNFLGIRMDSRKAEGLKFTMNLITPDNGEKFVVELNNATLTNLPGFLAENPDLSLTINRSDLEQTMMGAKSLESQIQDGTAKVKGDVSILAKLAATMVDFDPLFEIMPGTKVAPAEPEKANPYEAVPGKTIVE